MAFLKEKQGELGKLEERTDTELRDVLIRQKKLLTLKNLVEKMPDKGAKIRAMVERIESILKQREEVDETADMFHQMALDADKSRNSRDVEGEGSALKNLINQPYYNKLFCHEEGDGGSGDSVNTYHEILKKTDKHSHIGKTAQRFRPNKSINAKDIQDLPISRLVNLKLEDPKVLDVIDPTLGKITKDVQLKKKQDVIPGKVDVSDTANAADKVSEWLDRTGASVCDDVKEVVAENSVVKPDANPPHVASKHGDIIHEKSLPGLTNAGSEMLPSSEHGKNRSEAISKTNTKTADHALHITEDISHSADGKNDVGSSVPGKGGPHFDSEGLQTFASICENRSNIMAEEERSRVGKGHMECMESKTASETSASNTNHPVTTSSSRWTYRQPGEKLASGLRSPTGSVVSNASSRLRYKYDDCLETAATWRDPQRESVKAISLKDSIILMEKQKKQMQSLLVKQAGERLSHRLNVQPATWDPEGSSKMKYRARAESGSDDGDSDDDAEIMDYPD